MAGHSWCICRSPEKKVKRKPHMGLRLGLVLGVPKKKGKNVHEESDTRHKLLCEDICDLDSEDDNEYF
jgi:hypothetical protein